MASASLTTGGTPWTCSSPAVTAYGATIVARRLGRAPTFFQALGVEHAQGARDHAVDGITLVALPGVHLAPHERDARRGGRGGATAPPAPR